MKLKNEFITYSMDGQEILVGTGKSSFKGMVKANSSASFILSCLKEDITEEELVRRMMEKYDAGQDQLEKDVRKILNDLRSIGAIDE